MLDEVRREAAAVTGAIGREVARLGATVTPMICVHNADLPLFGSRLDGIEIVSGRGLVKRMRRAPPVLPPESVDALAAAIRIDLGRRVDRCEVV